MRLLAILLTLLLILSTACRKKLEDTDASDGDSHSLNNIGVIIPDLLVSFVGKGSKLAWDIGGIWATMEHLAIPEEKIIFAGSSSGSLLSAYFACHSVSPAAIAQARDHVEGFDRRLVNETKGKISAAIFNTDPSYPHSNVTPFLDSILQGCSEPTLWRPMAIVAANNDILEMRRGYPGYRGDDKAFDYRSNTVVTPGVILGKACTYFVNPAMFAIMQQVPYQERLCDLRMLTTLDDVKFAVLASISEPTYFPAVVEMQPEKSVDVALAPGQRWYNGGFIMNTLVQDIKRPMPHLKVLSSGHVGFSKLSIKFIQKRFLANMDLLNRTAKWWLDLELLPTSDEIATMNSQRTPHQTIMAMGCRRAHYCLNNGCNDLDVEQPYFQTSVAAPTIFEVPRARGLEHLLKPTNTIVQTCPY